MPATSTVQITTHAMPSSTERTSRLPVYLQALPPYQHKQALNLLAKLHTCLDLEALLQSFYQGVPIELPDFALSIDCPECYLPVPVKHGDRQCLFHMIIDDEYLCDLNLYSCGIISASDIEQLNLWFSVLAFPLRNAIQLHKMRMQVFRDGLTGVQNRIALDQALNREIASAQRHQTELSLLIIDIDHFKSINDRYGHSRGDLALQATTNIIRDCLRNSDQIFRYGGEEFVVLLTHTEPLGSYILAERIRKAMSQREHLISDLRIPITVSIGYASMQWNDTSDSLFDKADKALYSAKHAGRDRVCCLDTHVNNEMPDYSQQLFAVSSLA